MILAITVIILALAVAVVWPTMTLHKVRSEAPASITQVGRRESKATAALLDATGYVTARQSASVSAQVTGTLAEVVFEEGDHVRKGQLLARLDDRAFRALVASSAAELDAARAKLEQLKIQQAQLERDFGRARALVQRKLLSQQLVEQAESTLNATRAETTAQQFAVRAAEANVQNARVNLEYTMIRAPFDGVVTVKSAQVGETVSPLSAGGGFTRTGIGTVVDMTSLEVQVDVNEAHIGRIITGMPARIALDAYPDSPYKGHVLAIIPSADRGKATVRVRVAFDGLDSRCLPEMGARVSFLDK